MYLIIREDSQCAERTPPWGEPTIERYVGRVRENLAALRRFPRLKIGFEWSAVELELLAQDGPDVLAEMCALAKEGRVAFYNGTYAQPHLQTHSSEANYRQFEYGLRVYRNLCPQDIRVYAHQESSTHDQLPQLLCAFGIRFATMPYFYTTLAWLDEGELVQRENKELRFVHGHEFVAWQGLDGSQVNMYLPQPHSGTAFQDWVRQEEIAGLLQTPPIIIQGQDMRAVDAAWLAQYDQADFVLLDEALEERVRRYPPRARARVFSPWSYIEGMRAEELSRCNWRAEAAALRAEALNALAFTLVDRQPPSSEAIWKDILTSQHHDVYCFSAPELRTKAIGWLREAEKAASVMADDAAWAIVAQMHLPAAEGWPLVVFGLLPHEQQALVTTQVPVERPTVISPHGEAIPAEATPVGNGMTRLRFLAHTSGLGYATYRVKEGGEIAEQTHLDRALEFENDFYRATVLPDATFTSLLVKPGEGELLDTQTRRGNQITATDSTGINPPLPDLETPQEWQPPQRGPELYWQPTAAARLRRSRLGLTLLAVGRLGSHVRADATVMFYHHLPRIDVEWTFAFDEPTCIGTFYDDETKLRVHWPPAFAGSIHHDIAFGVVREYEERPFFPASWVDICDGRKGFAYLHRGTPKHWVKERALVNLFAWGEHSNAIGNRVSRWNWRKSFDQRLRGEHTVCCAIYPHTGNWQAADIVGAARNYATQPPAYLGRAHDGCLPANLTILTFGDRNLATTAVKVEGSQVLCRVYALDQTASLAAQVHGLGAPELRSLSGERTTFLTPFQIGHVHLERCARDYPNS